MKKLERVLEKLLAPRSLHSQAPVHVELATSLWLTGQWAESKLRPRLHHEGARDSNALLVTMSDHSFVVTAETFAWLSRQHELSLSDLSLNPDVLETLRRTQAQAAAASDYSVQDDDVALLVVNERGVQYRVERTRGVVFETEQP